MITKGELLDRLRAAADAYVAACEAAHAAALAADAYVAADVAYNRAKKEYDSQQVKP